MSRPETIYALSSGAGRAGIAVVRLSGPDVPRVLQELTGSLPEPRMAALRTIRDPSNGEIIDSGLALYFPKPSSFTGEDVAEFQIHGSIAVIRRLMTCLAQQDGCGLADPGEFTQRAFLNGQLDLVDVEALGDTLAAETEMQRKLAVNSSRRLHAMADAWRAKLLELRAITEAYIDFADEGDVEQHIDSQTEQEILVLKNQIESVLAGLKVGERIRSGYRIAILGPPNAGKSSLFNALADRDVAITSPIAGTTRDVLETVIDLDGVPVVILDTAGLRDEPEAIEREGIQRALRAARDADLVIWANPIDSPVKSPEASYLEIVTKADLLERPPAQIITISSKTGHGLDNLIQEIRRRALQGYEDMSAFAIIAHQRQADELKHASFALSNAAKECDTTLDIRAEHLRWACDALDQLVGRIGTEEVLGAIFSRFCIGK